MRLLLLFLLTIFFSLPLSAEEPVLFDSSEPCSEASEDSLSVGDDYTLPDSIVIPKQNLLKPLAETLLINLTVWSWDHFIGNRGWADVRWHHIKQNLRSNLVLDTDSYSGNQFSHPFHGSLFFNAARYHGNNYYVSMLYPLVGSITWEYFCETNLPSYNDFLSTGIGGSIIGETTHRATDLIFDNTKTGLNRLLREIAGSLLNPVRGTHRLFSGEMFRVASTPGKRVESEPFTFQTGLYYRHQHELRGKHRSKDLVTLDFDIDYGDRFEPRTHQAPFQHFQAHMSLNIAESNPTFGNIDIRGRLYGWPFQTKHEWRHDFALFQNYRYIDNYGSKTEKRAGNYPLISEACSFGVSMASEKQNDHTKFHHDLSVNGVVFGGTTADYFRPRYYNFASGFSIRDQLNFSLNRRFTLGNDFYFARLFVPHGGTDLSHRSQYYWGDRGNNSISLNRSYLLLRLSSSIQFAAEYTLYYRRSNYSYLPTVHAKSNEFRLGFIYDI